ncbi:MAG: class IIb bacteriocin, lactobin A/cerein 7B family [Clostridiales bacterium]|nr:class IIb bacteriocin, lactobin A/cerein 7B family [Clostridiales bacterium]
MELVLNNNFTSLDLNELENIDGGNFASKVGSGLILVGTIGLTIACPPVGAAAKIARYATIGASAIGLFE